MFYARFLSMHEQVLSLLLMEKVLDKDDLTELLLLVEQLQSVSTCWTFMFFSLKMFPLYA